MSDLDLLFLDVKQLKLGNSAFIFSKILSSFKALIEKTAKYVKILMNQKCVDLLLVLNLKPNFVICRLYSLKVRIC